MNIFDIIILGLVQGLTEFLPISSSGHLVIFKNILNVNSQGLFVEIALHFGTMIAVCAFFWKDLYHMIKGVCSLPIKLISRKKISVILDKDPYTKLSLMVILATIPTAIIALIFKDSFEKFFNTPILVGIMLIVTGTILWFTKSINSEKNLKHFVGPINAIIIGIVQGMAITPGISRSGTTIATATFLGINKELAAKFSFLLSIPAILGAVVTNLDGATAKDVNITNIIIGTVVSCVVGYISIRFLVKLIKKGKFYLFSYYCWLVGIIAIVGFVIKA